MFRVLGGTVWTYVASKFNCSKHSNAGIVKNVELINSIDEGID
jgi:hypothetical protein